MAKNKKGTLPLVSLMVFLGVLTFVSIKSTAPGSTDQVLAGAFSALVSGVLMLKYSWWESIQPRGHVLLIALSVGLLLAWVSLYLLLNTRSKKVLLNLIK